MTWIARLAIWLNQAICWRHEFEKRHDAQRWYVACLKCGWETEGVVLDGHPPIPCALTRAATK